MNCEQVGFDLAVEALTGGRETTDAAGDAHLAQCASCRRKREELRGLAGLLASVTPWSQEEMPAPDPQRAISALRGQTAAPPTIGAAGPARARPWPLSHTVLALGFAFAAGLLVHRGLLTAVEVGHRGTRHRHGALRVVSAVDSAGGADADAELHARPWGTEITLSLEWERLSGPRRCRLVAVSASGEREAVVNWRVPAGGYAVSARRDRLTLTGSSSLALDEIAALEVETAADCD
ncbi:hypothetical protein ABTZ58_23735 [Streptomyces sp. NPDC094143]|uniref:hypothetical protein n=1 Tax=Streptomyces sp. NPDC094143 TaxID=3155310 RepID=UPI00332E2C1B